MKINIEYISRIYITLNGHICIMYTVVNINYLSLFINFIFRYTADIFETEHEILVSGHLLTRRIA